MTQSSVTKFSISLPQESVRYLERYQAEHGISSRSEAIDRAVRALRELELIEGYRQAAADHQRNPDPLVDSGIGEGLEPSDGNEWI